MKATTTDHDVIKTSNATELNSGAMTDLKITVEFRYISPGTNSNSMFLANVMQSSGGLEMLFDNKSKHNLVLPMKTADGAPTNIASLVRYLCDHKMRDARKELFVLDGSV